MRYPPNPRRSGPRYPNPRRSGWTRDRTSGRRCRLMHPATYRRRFAAPCGNATRAAARSRIRKADVAASARDSRSITSTPSHSAVRARSKTFDSSVALTMGFSPSEISVARESSGWRHAVVSYLRLWHDLSASRLASRIVAHPATAMPSVTRRHAQNCEIPAYTSTTARRPRFTASHGAVHATTAVVANGSTPGSRVPYSTIEPSMRMGSGPGVYARFSSTESIGTSSANVSACVPEKS